MPSTVQVPWKRTVFAILAFGFSFGYVEAAIVDYLGVVYNPVRHRIHPDRSPDDVFPLLTLEQLQALAPEQRRLVGIEVVREIATLVMLGAVALTVARNAGQWAAAFVIAFGSWDISFYVFLKVLLDWPASLMTWDLLFLVPVPWAAPVLAPILVSGSMIVAGVWHLRRESLGLPVRLKPLHWIGMSIAAFVMILSFTLDHQNISAGGIPRSFNWTLFAAGEAIGVLSYLSATRRACKGPDRRTISHG